MSNVEKDLTKFKLEVSRGWRLLQTHKWRRPKWMKISRSWLEDPRWLKLSPQAAQLLINILLIASEMPDCELPRPDLLYLRLRATGAVFYRARFLALINELIQSGFVLSTTPELQSTEYRVQKEEKENLIKEKEKEKATRTVTVGNEEGVENPHHLGQPKRSYSKLTPKRLVPTSEVMEILGIVPRATSATTPNHFTYQEATARSSGPPSARFEKTRHNGWEFG